MAPRLPATPTISVIVATRNRRAALTEFLGALEALKAPAPWDLVVADNGSTDGTAELLADAATRMPLVSVYEPRVGKSRALNLAMSRAQGEIFLFTDDDAIPDAQWLSALIFAAMDHPNANVFGGKVLVQSDTLPLWIANSYNLKTMLASEQNLGDQICWFEKNRYPVGPNLAVRRRCLNSGRICWPVNLGPGTHIPLGDEQAFLMQVSPPERRDRLYVPGSIVRHINRRSLSVGDSLRRCFLGGYAAGINGKKSRPAGFQKKAHLGKLVRQRLSVVSSTAELACVTARAAGVAAGTIIPFPRIIYG